MPRNSSQSPSKESSTPQVSWTDAESEMLLEIIASHKASAGDGLNFKMAFWNAAAAQLPAPTKGAPKTAKSCKERWQRMKKTFDVVDRIANASGFTYSLESGANIALENEAVWSDFLKKNKHAGPFRNKGWPHYEKMKQFMPSKGKGLNRFSALSIDDAQPSGGVRLSTSESESPQGSVDTIGLSTSPPWDHQPAPPASDSAQTGPTQSSMPANPSSDATPPLLLSTTCEPTPSPSTQTQATPTWHSDQSQTPFSPPSVPSSFNGSAISSIKPSSSVSARMVVSRKRPADDDGDESMSASFSATAHSSTSSGRKRRAGNTDIVRELGGLRSDIKSHFNTFESAISGISGRVTPRTKSDSGSRSVVQQARQNLLQLDAGRVSQSDIALLFTMFQREISFADGYLLLVGEGFEVARLAYLQEGIRLAMERQNQ